MSTLYTLFRKYPRICTDTRKIEEGCLFFALKGANFDGNRFAEAALAAGAAYAVVDDAQFALNDRIILVDNVLQSLQELARHHRSQLQIPVIGITGSNGKTTTKELLQQVLKQKFNVFATEGNLNNHIGVPVSVLQITPKTQIAVIEMGANHVGEIGFLCGIAQPDFGLITNVGRAHLEGFGSFEGVMQAKGELYGWLGAGRGLTFIQRDNPFLADMASRHGLTEVAYYGAGANGELWGEVIENFPYLKIAWHTPTETYLASSRLTGAYNLENILAAIRVALHFGLSADEINAGIATYQPRNNRSQITQTERGNTVICDFYNANASSMEVALNNLSQMPGHHKMAILGDMFELGEEAEAEHLKIIHAVRDYHFEQVIYVGQEFSKHRHADMDALFFAGIQEAISVIQDNHFEDKLILLKASRGMAFEKILETL